MELWGVTEIIVTESNAFKAVTIMPVCLVQLNAIAEKNEFDREDQNIAKFGIFKISYFLGQVLVRSPLHLICQ